MVVQGIYVIAASDEETRDAALRKIALLDEPRRKGHDGGQIAHDVQECATLGISANSPTGEVMIASGASPRLSTGVLSARTASDRIPLRWLGSASRG